MKFPCTQKSKAIITGAITLLLVLHLSWDYFHGGIPTHYILHDGDLPGFSNLLGLIVLPLFSWILLSRICRRLQQLTKENKQHSFKNILMRFSSALSLGILLSALYLIYPDGTFYIMLSLFALAFFIKLYWSEYLLGFVIGSAFTFGVMIPSIAGILLIGIYAMLYTIPRYIVGFLNKKIKV